MAQDFWRKEDPVMVNGQVVTGGMWAHQREWWNAKEFIKALVTGYGGGKTNIGSKRAISVALMNAPSPFLAVSPSYKIAKRTLIPTIRALLNGKRTLLSGFDYQYNKSDHEFLIYYGDRVATIWIASGDDPTSLVGPNIGAALIDEPFTQEREVFDQVVARVRDPVAKHQEIGLTGTPEQLNWGYDICEGEERDKWDLKLVQASTRGNLALGGQEGRYVQTMLRGFTAQAVKAYVDGQFVSLAEGLVYYGFDRFKNVVDLPDPGHSLEVGMDFNVDPMAAVVFWTNGNHMHVVDEVELPNSDTEDMCKVLHERYPGRIRNIYPDASGKARKTSAPGGRSDFWYIQQAGFDYYCKDANPPVRDRYNAVNGKLDPAAGTPTLTFSPKCRKLISYQTQYSHRTLNKQRGMSHLLDALGYPVAYKFPVRPLPESFQLVGH